MRPHQTAPVKPRELTPNQKKGVEFMLARNYAINGDFMGLGKSIQAVEAALQSVVKVVSPAILVICQSGKIFDWRDEFMMQGVHASNIFVYATAASAHTIKTKGVVIMSYDTAAKFSMVFSAVEWDVVIIDEAQNLKSRSAERTVAVYGTVIAERSSSKTKKGERAAMLRAKHPKLGIIEKAKRVYLLSGTLMKNYPSELWVHLRRLFPEVITTTKGKIADYWKFVDTFCDVEEGVFGRKIIGGKNMNLLHKKLAAIQIRRLGDKDLPPVTWGLHRVEAIPTERAKLDMVLADKNVVHLDLENLEREAAHYMQLRKMIGLAKVAPTAEYIRELVEDGEAVVVFAYSLEVMDALQAAVKDLGVIRVDGSVPPKKRYDLCQEFEKGEAMVFLGQLQAAGTGLNLVKARTVLIVEADWVPSNNAQAVGRCRRMTQTRPVNAVFIAITGSIDEQIQGVLRRKAEISKIVFNNDEGAYHGKD